MIGVGGCGANAINNMIRHKLTGVEFILACTDAQAIEQSETEVRLELGGDQTRGLRAGAKPKLGKEAAELEKTHLRELLVDTDILFITAGMGGGTGTEATPVIAEVAKDMGILSVGIVTKPFGFEGLSRMKKAEEGIDKLSKFIDALIVIPNHKNLAVVNEKTSLIDSFLDADNIFLIYQTVKAISDLITGPSYLQINFLELKSMMIDERKVAMMGTGRSSGANRVYDAVEQVFSSSLLGDLKIQDAHALMINITGNENILFQEFSEVVSAISEKVDKDAKIICGFLNDPNMGDELSITVIATGLKHLS